MGATTTVPPPAPIPAALPVPPGLTLGEFLARHAGAYVEVIDGEVKDIPTVRPLHGNVCFNAALYLGGFIEQNALGTVCTNDTFVLIRADPLRVRGAGAVYWGTAKAPDGVPRAGLIAAPPDLCVEVVSPTNTWSEVSTTVGEYLGIGTPAVLVLDPNTATVSVYRGQPGQEQQIFHGADTLTLPDVLPGLSVPVARFFE